MYIYISFADTLTCWSNFKVHLVEDGLSQVHHIYPCLEPKDRHRNR